MNNSWRIILDKKNNGYYNMALDEAILNNYNNLKIPTFRIYGFDKPFISLGYNQKIKDVLKEENKIPVVRRITGGEAVFHNDELTYSIVCSIKDLDLPKSIKESYKKICSFLINFYRKLNLNIEFPKEKKINSNFCLSNFMQFDILIDSKKIGGNAQRRKKDIIFHQGYILQNIDFKKIYENIKDIKDIESKVNYLYNFTKYDFYSLEILLKESFKETFFVNFVYDKLTDQELNTCKILLKEKYTQYNWNYRI